MSKRPAKVRRDPATAALARTPFYKWLRGIDMPHGTLNEALAQHLEVSVSQLPRRLNGEAYDRCRAAWDLFWELGGPAITPAYRKARGQQLGIEKVE